MWHTRTRQFPPGRWDVAGGGFVDRDRFVPPEGLQMEYGPLFAYMFRRFGPPEAGSDDHKEIACWYLTTPNRDVLLWVSPRPSGAKFNFGYGVNERKYNKPRDKAQQAEVIAALQAAIRDLLTPTNVRDVYINGIGVVREADVRNPVKPFKYAGIGIDHEQLAKIAAEDDEGD